jgi:putative copper export protein
MLWLIFFHVLSASVWLGGHLILVTTFLPKALKEKDPHIIQSFEEKFERIGIPALLLQVITGVWMSLIYVPLDQWLSLASSHHRFLWMKLALLAGTLGLAIHARLFIIPKLSAENLPSLAFHIVLVTLLALSFVLVGLSFRFNFL